MAKPLLFEPCRSYQVPPILATPLHTIVCGNFVVGKRSIIGAAKALRVGLAGLAGGGAYGAGQGVARGGKTFGADTALPWG